MVYIGIHLDGKALRAQWSNCSVVSWCSQELANELGLKIVPPVNPKKGITSMGEKIQFAGTVTATVELSQGLRLDNFEFMVANVRRPIVCLGMDFHSNFDPCLLDFGKNCVVLNGIDQPLLEITEQEKYFASPSIIAVEDLVSAA